VHFEDAHPARFFHPTGDGRLQCDVCPRACQLRDGQRGLCFVRAREGDRMVLTTYGRSSGFCLDPIEKKPLFHFLPGSSILSFGTAGCNLTCKFCQNWDISKSREMDTLVSSASPEAIARAAKQSGARSVAFTYNDPVIFHEYAVDTAIACHALGIKTVAVTAGYHSPQARAEFYRHMDAANIDLKGFTERFYQKICGGELGAVLDTLRWVRHESETWFEITTLLIPGENDSPEEIDRMTQWIARELGGDVPLHFTAFHPDFKMTAIERTPLPTLLRAREIAKNNGLHHVYVGNVHHPEAESTYCHACGALLVERDWYEIGRTSLTSDGRCRACGERCAGVFDGPPQNHGRTRVRVHVTEG
jgi:pyruvate formate lyase activating enzyme